MNKSVKPRLIGLEGPAAAGKTTMQRSLYNILKKDGMDVDMVPEFSNSQLGALLREGSQFGSSQGGWQSGLGGVLAYLSDKIYNLEFALATPNTVWISDRLITSQFVLGLRRIESEDNKTEAQIIIQELTNWMQSTFSEDSILIMLDADITILQRRLESRLNNPLSEEQLVGLRKEQDAYSRLKLIPGGWRILRKDSKTPLDVLTKDLIEEIYIAWTH